MGQRPDGAREPPTGSSGNRCSWNVSCRWAVAGERGRHVLYYRQAGPSCRPVQLGGNPRPPVTTMQASAGTGPTALPGPALPASMRCVPGPGSRGREPCSPGSTQLLARLLRASLLWKAIANYSPQVLYQCIVPPAANARNCFPRPSTSPGCSQSFHSR